VLVRDAYDPDLCNHRHAGVPLSAAWPCGPSVARRMHGFCCTPTACNMQRVPPLAVGGAMQPIVGTAEH
jgi:hypothetical protein